MSKRVSSGSTNQTNSSTTAAAGSNPGSNATTPVQSGGGGGGGSLAATLTAAVAASAPTQSSRLAAPGSGSSSSRSLVGGSSSSSSSGTSTRSSASRANSASERSNEVPPSFYSAPTASASTAAGSGSNSGGGGGAIQRQTSSSNSRSANDFTSHFDNIDPPQSQQPLASPSMGLGSVSAAPSLSSSSSSSSSSSGQTGGDGEAVAASGLTPTIVKSESSLSQRSIKKRPISGVLSTETDAELTCPICFDVIDVAHVTKCGHSFCQTCIQTALEHTHRCPKCNTPCTMHKDVFPNFTLNQIIERYKEETQAKKCKFSQNSSSTLIEYINSAQEDLNLDEVDMILNILSQRKEELKFSNKKMTEYLLHDFLKHLQQVKTEELNKIQHELHILNEDCKQVEEIINTFKSTPEQVSKSEPVTANASTSNSPSKKSTAGISASSSTNSLSSTVSLPVKSELTTAKTSPLLTPSSSVLNNAAAAASASPEKFQSILANKKRIIHRYFDELSQKYAHSHNKDFKEFFVKDTTKGPSQSYVLDKLRHTVSKITNCSEFRSIASVNYNSDLYSMSSIVSSVDFDRSYEHFAIAGVTKRIKIFDFNNILYKPQGIHYPLYEMVHNAKLSCISWNRYFRQQLACSDYEGVVTLWDAEQASLIRSYQEHEKRCWSVQFCDVDPRLIASASDDSKVKIWSTNSEYSLMSLDAKSNVCCVIFKPDSKFNVLFGTADHSIHYYDLRNPKEPVSLFKGHRKAVSYVKFTSGNEFVSASTDSHLKMWRLNEGQCIRSFTGHTNEKNFVGLDTHDGFIMTGSENNTVYLYSTELTKPLLTYKFEDTGVAKKDESVNDFVSAVCWSNTNHVLAANSQGIVKILELV